MLIFVQVYKTIDKNLISLFDFGRTKESKGTNKKEAWSIWWKVHLQYKCSWSDDVIRSKFVRSISSEARSPEAEVHQEMRDLKLQRLGNEFNLVQHCIRLTECYHVLCERIWKHWMLVLSRAFTKDNCTNCTTTSSTTLFVYLQQDKNNNSACRKVPSN